VTSPFISASDLATLLDGSESPVILDASLVLHPAKFDGDYRRDSGYPRWLDAHIPGSRHVDVSTQFSDTSALLHYSHPTPQAIEDELARLGIAAGTAVVVYDSTGTLWASRLWYLLRWIGVNARVLDGGLAAWREAGGPMQAGEIAAPVAVAPWSATATTDAWIEKDELLERAADDARPLVCGLPAGSFTGTDPTRYSRRGRIPGSVNVSSRDLFGRDGTVLSADEVGAAYEAAGVTADAPEVLLYCGGGISAAGSALTLAAVGVTNVRIYDGSLEEWSADPALPLVVGP
jgi:thiosulfate/3-mercaptopyruvate sulfurtransferase